jgi:hypothetical protein
MQQLGHKSILDTLIVRMVQVHQIINVHGDGMRKRWKVIFNFKYHEKQGKNLIDNHFDFIVKMFSQLFFTWTPFPLL